jgi:tungstate transport system substrate-binding protein
MNDTARKIRSSVRRFAGIALGALLAIGMFAASPARAADPVLTFLAADSAQDSGILKPLVAAYEKANRAKVVVIAGTADSLAGSARKGAGDVLLLDDHELHMRLRDEKVVGTITDLMYGELIVVGPKGDPASIDGMVSAIDAFRAISQSEAPFISRGDGSAVHRVEESIWRELSLYPAPSRSPWYTITKARMAVTLDLAAAKQAYLLTDQASWLALKDKKGLIVHVDDDPRLMLRYGISLIQRKSAAGEQREPSQSAETFIKWLSGRTAQDMIKKYEIGDTLPFHPQFGLEDE